MAKLWHMPRPKKDPSLVKGETLRIPVSPDEKRRIHAAALATDGEFAKWARTILLNAADDYTASQEAHGRSPRKRGRLKESA